jgi:hypothetical protein
LAKKKKQKTPKKKPRKKSPRHVLIGSGPLERKFERASSPAVAKYFVKFFRSAGGWASGFLKQVFNW